MSETNQEIDQALYQQLKAMARKLMIREREGHTLSPTDLVHEAYVSLLGKDMNFESQLHHYHTLARQMRRLLVDYSRKKNADKRQGSVNQVMYTDSLGLSHELYDFEVINEAMNELNQMDERSGLCLELVYFAALPQKQAAEVIGISLATLERDLKFGRAYVQDFVTQSHVA